MNKSSFLKKLSEIKGNVVVTLLINFAFVMLLSTVCRILFYAFNTGFYRDMSFLHLFKLLVAGLRFDLVGLVYMNMIYIVGMLIPFKFRYNKVYQKVLKYIFFIFNAIAIAGNCIDIIYFRFTMRRTTVQVLREFQHENNMGKLFADFFVQYWPILLIFIALMVLMVICYRTPKKPEFKSSNWVYYPTNFAIMLIGATLVVFAARGDYSTLNRPITLSNAAEYTSKPIEMPLVQSTPMAFLKSISEPDIAKIHYFDSEEELEKIYSPIHNYQASGDFKYKNVVILILESFGGEHIAAFNEHTENFTSYTPFLDSLMQQSKYFLYSYANGRKSIDAMPSILASIPSINGSYVLFPYSSNEINGIASMLRPNGYNTAFFHGAPNGSMGFNGIANLTGFEKYYGMTEYGNDADFDKTGGIFDEEFLQYFARTMNEMKQPFCTTVFTLSSHTPFTLPERYKEVFKVPSSPFLSTVRYSDNALRQFFKTASKMPWYNNTLFVLSADHGGTYLYHDQYKNEVGTFSIPIVFFAPGDSTMRGREDRLAQQSDILPSVLSYLNYNGSFVAFGNNLMEHNEEDIVVNYANSYQLFWKDYVIHFDGKKITELFKFKEDPFLKNNLVGQYPEVEKTMTLKIKAYLQQYTSRIIDNKMHVIP